MKNTIIISIKGLVISEFNDSIPKPNFHYDNIKKYCQTYKVDTEFLLLIIYRLFSLYNTYDKAEQLIDNAIVVFADMDFSMLEPI